MKKLNVYEYKECILVCGDNSHEKVINRIAAIIKCRSIQRVSRPFSLAIDVTKLTSVPKISSAYEVIFRAEYLNNFINIKGLVSDKTQKILDGKSDKYGKLAKATEVKVSIIIFKDIVCNKTMIQQNSIILQLCLYISLSLLGCNHDLLTLSTGGISLQDCCYSFTIQQRV